jgi:CRP-like cAMP-binding protein
MFGEMALVSEGRRFASARAVVPETRLVKVDQARFVYLVSQQPAFALSVIRMMAERLAKAGQQTIALAEGA